MKIILDQAQIAVVDMPGQPGIKTIVLMTQQGIEFQIPLPEAAAKTIAAGLTSGLIVAAGPLKSPNGKLV